MPKIAVDPVTRIEGHLRVEAQVEGGREEAWVVRGAHSFRNRAPPVPQGAN